MAKTVLRALLFLILLTGGAVGVFYLLYEYEGRSIRVVDAKGKVEKKTEGGVGWVELKAGEKLGSKEWVRTGPEGEATLVFHDDSRISLAPQSEFGVEEIRREAGRFRLGEGKITARIKKREGRIVRIDAEGSDASLKASEGEFSMLSDRRGMVAVASRSGDAALSAQNRTVRVLPGTHSVVLPGEAPSEAQPIPTSIYLKVEWPEQKSLNTGKIAIAGKTVRGAVVSINGVRAIVDKVGGFEADVPLHDGENTVTVATEDVAGNTRVEGSPPIVVDRKAPEIKVESKKLWKN